jgi:hypothetical protein
MQATVTWAKTVDSFRDHGSYEALDESRMYLHARIGNLTRRAAGWLL